MSVYKPAKSSFFAYDFILKGKRYTGSTGQRNKRAALRVEDKIREEAKLGLLDDAAQYTLDQAAGLWWEEKGRHNKTGQRTHPDKPTPIEARMQRMIELVGPSTRLADIDQACVARAIERRRGKATQRSKAKDAKAYLPANSTVNRDVISLLRPVLKRARTHWGAKGLPEIAWGDLLLEAPRETVKVYSLREEARWLDECTRTGWRYGKPSEQAADVSLALDIILTYGVRLGELFFRPDQFDPDSDPDGAKIVFMKGRKGDVPHEVQLLERHARQIQARLGRAVAAGLPHMWFYEKRNGDLVPITIGGMQERLNNAADRAQVSPGRRIHGGRHHALTLFYRETKDLKLTQMAGGHLDPASTLRYVHADRSAVRAALKARETEKSRNSPGPEPGEAEKAS